MVIESYLQGPGPVYERARTSGRMLPPGLTYRESWVAEPNLDRCFQLMETDDPTLFETWIESWSDLVAFEIVQVIGSAEASARS
jgi:hypothetical protein